MVKFFNKIRTILLFILVAYRMIKFAIVLGYSGDEKARRLITRNRWRISQMPENEIKNQFLNFFDIMEKERFPNDK